MDPFLRLDRAATARFLPLAPTAWRGLLAEADVEGPVIAIGSMLLGQPVALGLAQVPVVGEEGRVHSIAVAPAFRRQGLGTALLARLEAEMAREGAAEVRATYAVGKPATPALERILEKRGWAPPQPYLVYCRVQGDDARAMTQVPWISRFRLPDEFGVFSWAELSGADRERLLQQHAEEPVWEEGLDPFSLDRDFEPINSVGLRHRGEVIGWVITQRVASGLVRYTQLFVRREFRTMARGVALLAESIRRHGAREGHHPDFGGVWQTKASNATMIAFIRRRMGPYLTEMSETWESRRRLG